ncbi:MAG TPA: ECF-type sigma factor [Kofleriaceae bacterium]|nr:ECF-type sigma factor [Kofleriaceae bacterium]
MGEQGARVPDDLAVVAEAVTSQDRRSLDALYSATYEQLRRLAATIRRGSPALTLSPTTLVNEAWVKLAASPGVASTSLLHFKRIAARAMRQVLVEAARRRYAGKRGGREVNFVTLDESVAQAGSTPSEILALDAALDELARLQPRQAQMVECRFFGGLDIAETARLLEVSEATIQRDWRAVRAWLARTLRQAS